MKDVIVNIIQKNLFNGYDIASSLENMKIINLIPDNPKRFLSTNKDTTLANIDQTGLDI